jgi:hypothetical protein
MSSSEKTISDPATVVELQHGHTFKFGTSRIYLGRVLEMQRLGYFGNGVGRASRAKDVPEPEGELVVFEAFFVAGLRLPAHRFVVEVLRKFKIQIHQLTPNAMVALAKYVWAVSSYGGEPYAEVFAKNYCLHWQKRKIGGLIAQFGSCTFTPRTGKTSAEVIEIVPCAKNKWGNWWYFWFYVARGDVEWLPTLPPTILCSHCYVAFPHFKVKKGDRNEEALRYATRLSSDRDLVEEFVACGVWSLTHGWDLGEVRPRRMPTLGDKMVRGLAFIVYLQGRDAAAFVREVESKAIKIVGKYVPKTEMLRSQDIRGSNVRLNHVFELNSLPYGPYSKGYSTDAGDDRGKQVKTRLEEGTSKGKADVAVTRKRKIDLQGTGDDEMGPRASGIFVEELMGTCAGPGEVMSSPELQETSSRKLKFTGGRCHRKDPIPGHGDDYFTSRLARELRIFSYGRNIHYRKRVLCRVPKSTRQSLKNTRQRRLGKQCIDKAFFVEYFFSGTRQRGLPSAREHSAKKSSHYGDG